MIQSQIKCPVCKSDIELVWKSASRNPKTEAAYERRVFHCLVDDVWVSTEVPVTQITTTGVHEKAMHTKLSK